MLSSVILFFALGITCSIAQDVEQTYSSLRDRLKEDPMRLTGMLNVDLSSYHAYGIDGRGVPFMGRLMGYVNLDILGVNIPGSVNIGSGGTVFNTELPSFAFIGISPRYKWATLHLGTRSLNMGKYSFSNHSFNGVGFELNPDNWRLQAFYGRLQRARPGDFLGIQRLEPLFQRVGFGVKGGFDNGRDLFLLSIFKAWDQSESIPIPEFIANVLPSENVILSIETTKYITENISLKAQFANSGFTADRNAVQGSPTGFIRNYAGLLETNVSSRWNKAFDVGLHLDIDRGSLSLNYERIDPGFRTMGALFFLNDLENIHFGLKLRFLRSKLQLAGRAGVQRNNISQTQVNSYQRFVGSIMLNYTISERLSISGSASSFNNVNIQSSIQDINAPVLVTEFVLNNDDFNFTTNYLIQKTDKVLGTIQLNTNLSNGNMIENDEIQFDSGSKSQSIMAVYMLQLLSTNWTLSSSLGRQEFGFGKGNTVNNFVGIGIQKSLFDNKLSMGINSNISANQQFNADVQEVNGWLINLSTLVSYRLSDAAFVSWNSFFLSNNTQSTKVGSQRFGELRSALVFNYRFK